MYTYYNYWFQNANLDFFFIVAKVNLKCFWKKLPCNSGIFHSLFTPQIDNEVIETNLLKILS